MIAELIELKNKNGKRVLRVNGASMSSLQLWNNILLGKGWKRIDDVHTRGIFSVFYKFPYQLHYEK